MRPATVESRTEAAAYNRQRRLELNAPALLAACQAVAAVKGMTGVAEVDEQVCAAITAATGRED